MANRESCPYKLLPDTSYWRRSISRLAPQDVDPVLAPKFTITPDDKIATAGSCFAQHISRYLSNSGYNYYVAEPGHSILSEETKRKFNYGTFSCRYANIYTTRQLLQTLQRAFGEFQPVDDVWEEPDGSFVDPFRPHIQPGGFFGRDELLADRTCHFRHIRAMVSEMDVFVFTLGLTETWLSTRDGAAYPVCPGCGAGTFDPDRYEFSNLKVHEVLSDLQQAVAMIKKVNPAVKILLTVSPVPLVATYETQHVLTATTYSKSVLRVAAEMASADDGSIDYFPSYEVISGAYAQGAHYDDDFRQIREEGVAHVMKLFFRHYLGQPITEKSAADSVEKASGPAPPVGKRTAGTIAAELVCEEEQLDPGTK